MDPSVCRLHPGVAVTGFCPACLRDRLAGLQPPSSADLRRCKSFSYARSAAAVEPQRRSCDLFCHQQQPIPAAVPEEDYQYQEEEAARPHEQEASSSRKSLGGLLGKKLQQWRRKNKKEPEMPGRQRHRPSCDDAVPELARLPATMLSLSVEEDAIDMMAPPPVPRSDGQIPVEEDYYGYGYGYGYDNAAAVPGGSAQTRDYYLDSSSSSRRRRSMDRSATSGRNSFSDANNGGELPVPSSRTGTTTMNANGNARVSPAIAAERLYHHYHEAQSVLVHHQYCRDGDLGSAFRHSQKPAASKTSKKGIRGWSIWGLINKKSSRKQQPDLGPSFSEAAAAGGGEYPWPELRARGYNGQMLRCNSSISARSSFSGGAAMIGGSGRRSISGVDMRDVRDGHYGGGGGGGGLSERRTRGDEVLLERTRSSSYSRSGHGLDPAMGVLGQYHQLSSRPPNIPRRSSSKHELSSLHRRSTLGL
ncbi:hypothetical protein BAE44_0013026 [Dichanthelium oligosanthes]|uniref:Uncharacterized protein n=1 Tax=Dichanthelium oligosanthes TaxID=888268 RepID=A0A1E5VLE0_9POAL|nr:hypothetical protein BAE44_0013026 [Dichanthelium oligosanthes]